MIKLLDILKENPNPFYKDYGNYLFGENDKLYGKKVEKDTEEEIIGKQNISSKDSKEDLGKDI